MARKSSFLKKISEELSNIDIEIEEMDQAFLGSLSLSLSSIEDYRHDSYTVHILPEILLIVIVGILSNCEEWKQLELFAIKHEKWFKNFLTLPAGIPSKDTMKRAITIIDPKELEKVLVHLMINLLEAYRKIAVEEETKIKDVISLDGKNCNSTGRRNSKDGKVKNIMGMSAFYSKYEITLDTEFIDEKTNEISAAPLLIRNLNLENIIVTADALNTQRNIVKEIISQKGDYVLALKANQGNTFKDIVDYFGDTDLLNECACKEEIEKSHSKIITYRYYLTTNIDWLYKKDTWENLTSIGCIEKEIYDMISEKTVVERRYYLTSIGEDIENFANSTREHWGIENKLHWHLDYTFKEDANLSFLGNSQKNLNIIRKFCLSILKLVKDIYNISLKNIRFLLSMDFENEINKILTYLNVDKIISSFSN